MMTEIFSQSFIYLFIWAGTQNVPPTVFCSCFNLFFLSPLLYPFISFEVNSPCLKRFVHRFVRCPFIRSARTIAENRMTRRRTTTRSIRSVFTSIPKITTVSCVPVLFCTPTQTDPSSTQPIHQKDRGADESRCFWPITIQDSTAPCVCVCGLALTCTSVIWEPSARRIFSVLVG